MVDIDINADNLWEESLKSLPDKIRKSELELYNLQENYETLTKDKEEMEFSYMLQITELKDENGKSVFSNDVKRKAELDRILNLDTRYKAIDLCSLKRQIKMLQIEIDFMSRRFRATESMIRLRCL